ncbi:MAG: hypothetical protein BMS9Abin36_1239 [Gammaproteobacteria bacterium]|nr:MAG: hypothetical protein BMS9Abin36_1239 [Gammaproteobacteria bacterium]
MSGMKDRRCDRSEMRQEAVSKQLAYIAKETDFDALVVSTSGGLKVGEMESRYESDELAALGGLLWEMRNQIDRFVNIKNIAGNTFVLENGSRYVCRFFEYRGEMLVLVGVTTHSDIDEEPVQRTITGVKRILDSNPYGFPGQEDP